jgi:hypothetical protein
MNGMQRGSVGGLEKSEVRTKGRVFRFSKGGKPYSEWTAGERKEALEALRIINDPADIGLAVRCNALSDEHPYFRLNSEDRQIAKAHLYQEYFDEIEKGG